MPAIRRGVADIGHVVGHVGQDQARPFTVLQALVADRFARVTLQQTSASSKPVSRTSSPIREKVRMLRIALNRIGERGTWSTSDLKIEIQQHRFGYCQPILIDQHNTIIDGHLRWEMAKEKG